MELQELINLITTKGYLLLFLMIVIEGPIATIIAGFLSSINVLNLSFVFPMVILGDIAGDVIYYYLGYFGREKIFLKLGKFFGVTIDKIKKLEILFHKHTAKALFIGKMSHGVGTAFLFAAGMAKVSFWKFLFFDFLPTIPKSILLLLIGFYFGESLYKINTYLDYTALGSFIIFIVLILIYFYFKKFGKKI